MLIPAAVIIAIAYYMDFKLAYRAIMSLVFFVLLCYLYICKLQNSEEFLKVVSRIKKLKQKKAELVQESNTEDETSKPSEP